MIKGALQDIVKYSVPAVPILGIKPTVNEFCDVWEKKSFFKPKSLEEFAHTGVNYVFAGAVLAVNLAATMGPVYWGTNYFS